MIDLRLGDCLELMRDLEDGSVDAVITSPPYDNLRAYGGHTWNFEGVASELFRVVKDGGVVVWVVGDATIKGSETGTSFRQALYFKDLGFRLHDTMIYRKTCYPRSGSLLAYQGAFEYMFVFAKGLPKTFNPIADKKNKYAGSENIGSKREVDGSLSKYNFKVKEHAFRDNVWDYDPGFMKNTKDAYAHEHPAIFPEALARDHILSWTNEGDTVLDCFMGSGTTGKEAIKLGRNFIGMEINKDYFAIAERRIREAQMQLALPMETA